MKLFNNKGWAIPLALMAIFVVTLLGTVLWYYSTAEVRQVAVQESKMQAHYIARSGAEAMAYYIINNPDEIDNMNSFVDEIINDYNPSNPTSLGNGEFTLRLSREDSQILITSDGVVNGITETVTLSVKEPLTEWMVPVFDNVIYSTTDMTIGGNTPVIGNFAASGDIKIGNNVTINGEYKSDHYIPYPDVVFPNNPSSENVTVDKDNKEYIINHQKTSYNSISIKQDGNLVFDVTNGDMTVIINEIDLQKGEITIIDRNGNNDAVLRLFLKSITANSNNTSVNITNSYPVNKFILLMPPDGAFTVSRFRGVLYAPGVPVTLNGGFKRGFHGAMVAGKFTTQGGSGVEYDPGAASLFPKDIPIEMGITGIYERGEWR